MSTAAVQENTYRIIPDACVGCAQCMKYCPSKAIIEVERKVLYEVVDAECSGCGICVIYCPTDAIVETGCDN